MTEVVLDFDAIFNAFIEANQKSWSHDRGSTLGASEVFDCLRKGWFEKRGKELGYVPDVDYEEDWGAMTRGNLIENHHVVPAVRDHMPEGLEVLYTGGEQETLVLDRSSATPDGLITGLPMNCAVRVKGGVQDILIPDIKSDCIVLEIKSIDPRATLVEERAKHHGQTQVQLGLFNDLTPYKPKFSIVLYIDASFLSKVTPFVIEFDEKIYKTARSRAADVWSTDEPTDILAEGRFSGACKHCKWRMACGTATVSQMPEYENELSDERVEELTPLVEEVLASREATKAAEKREGLAEEAVKAFLGKTNTKKVKSGTWSVTWFSNKGQSRLDTKAMEAAGIDLEPFRQEPKPFDVLRISPRLEKKKGK